MFKTNKCTKHQRSYSTRVKYWGEIELDVTGYRALQDSTLVKRVRRGSKGSKIEISKRGKG